MLTLHVLARLRAGEFGRFDDALLRQRKLFETRHEQLVFAQRGDADPVDLHAATVFTGVAVQVVEPRLLRRALGLAGGQAMVGLARELDEPVKDRPQALGALNASAPMNSASSPPTLAPKSIP